MRPARIPLILQAISRFVDLEKAIGLEVGPLDTPVLQKSQYQVKYLDYDTTEALKEKYAERPRRDATKIVDVDYALCGRSLKETVGDARFDYIFGSHCIEHVPDMIGWLQDAAEILTANGKILLIVPDKRYTFDIARPCTTLGQFIENHLTQKQMPSTADVVDQLYYRVTVNSKAVWDGSVDYAELCVRNQISRRRVDALAAKSRTEYVDAHCNVFASATFREVITELSRLGFHAFVIEELIGPEAPKLDFFCCLAKKGD